MEYIRNYANHINNSRIKILKKANVPEKYTSNQSLPQKYYKLVVDFIIDEL